MFSGVEEYDVISKFIFIYILDHQQKGQYFQRRLRGETVGYFV